MIQQPGGMFVEEASMTRQLKTFFAQLAYFDSALHLVVHGGPYPRFVHRVGNSTALSIVMQPSTKIFEVADVAVADFDGDLSDDLFAVRVRSSQSFYVLDPARPQQADFNIVDAGPASGVQLVAEGPARISLRIYSPSWKPNQVRIGAAAVQRAKYAREEFDGRTWRFVEVVLDSADPASQGMPNPSLRTTPGVYIGQADTGEWQVDMRGNKGQEFRASMITGDADFTRLVATGATASSIALQPALLFRRGGKFVNEAQARGVGAPMACDSVAAGDFDNDMDVDIYLSCTENLVNVDNVLLENTGGSFVPVASAGGAQTAPLGTGGRASVADYDNDGYLDLLITDGRANIGYPFHTGRRYLFHNQGGTNHWLRLLLLGCQSNRDGIGARVIVRAAGHEQARLQGGGVRNGVQDDTRLHFGLADQTSVESVVVLWPSGSVSTVLGLEADRTHTIQEDLACERP